MFFPIDERIDVVRSEFKSVAVRDGIGWASFHAVAAENATRIVNIVDARVTLPGGNAVRVLVFCRLDVDAVCGTRGRAKKTPHALLQAVFVAVQHVNATVARLEMDGFVRIILRNRLPEHIAEGYAKTFHQRAKRLAHFAKD